MSSEVYQGNQRKSDRKLSDWYSVSTATVRLWLTLIALGIVALVLFQGYGGWRTYWDEQRAYEWVSKTEGLMAQLEAQNAISVSGYRSIMARARGLLGDAKTALSEGRYADGASTARAAHSALQGLLDEVRLGSSIAWFRSVRGDVRFRRGESGDFVRAFARTQLHEGDYVMAGADSTAEIHFQEEDTVFTLQPQSLMKLSRSQRGNVRTLGDMEYGWVALDTAEESSGVNTRVNRVVAGEHSRASVAVERGSDRAVVRVREGRATATALESGEIRDLNERQEVVQSGGRFGETASLLRAPVLRSPVDGTSVNIDTTEQVRLAWNSVGGASTYALQVTRGRLFGRNLVDVERRSTSATLGLDEEGRYRWRVAAVDSSGRRGAWSEAARLRVESYRNLAIEPDEDPPPITLTIRMNGTFAMLQGQTEPGAVLTLNGEVLPTFADGSFSTTYVVSGTGRRPLVFEATDLSGNVTVERREVWLDEN